MGHKTSELDDAPFASPKQDGVRSRGVAVVEGALLFRLAPEDFVVSVGIEGGIDLGGVDGGLGESPKLGGVVFHRGGSSTDDAGVE